MTVDDQPEFAADMAAIDRAAWAILDHPNLNQTTARHILHNWPPTTRTGRIIRGHL